MLQGPASFSPSHVVIENRLPKLFSSPAGLSQAVSRPAERKTNNLRRAAGLGGERESKAKVTGSAWHGLGWEGRKAAGAAVLSRREGELQRARVRRRGRRVQRETRVALGVVARVR
jgi:hypothetical protein